MARDVSGRSQQGTREAASANAVVDDLRQRGLLVLDVRSAETESASTGITLAALDPTNWMPVASVDVELCLQQIAMMLRSGMTLLTSLKTVADQARKASMRRIWADVAEKIQQGSSLADAMQRHRCFSRLIVQLVRVGEQTGILDQVMKRGADALERRRHLVTSMLTAMTYPVIVLVSAFGVAGFMVVGVIPKLEGFLNSMGRQLPATTQLLVDISHYVQQYFLHGIILTLSAILAAVMIYLWPPGRMWVDKTALRVPIIGYLLRLAGTAAFARSMGTLLQSGITILESLRTIERLHANQYLAARVAHARQIVMQGGNLSDPLSGSGAFMPMLSRMIAIGDAAGTMDEVLEQVAEFHEMQLQSTIRQFSALIEPAIILVVGGIVGFVYVSFFLALFSASTGGAIR